MRRITNHDERCRSGREAKYVSAGAPLTSSSRLPLSLVDRGIYTPECGVTLRRGPNSRRVKLPAKSRNALISMTKV